MPLPKGGTSDSDKHFSEAAIIALLKALPHLEELQLNWLAYDWDYAAIQARFPKVKLYP